MSTTDQFLIGMQAYQEISAEMRAAKNHAADQAETDIEFDEAALSFPEGSLLLGLAEDGLPVILDLYNPVAGPLLVAGEGGSGKTAVLQSLARASGLQDPGDIQFAAISPFLEEWSTLDALPNSMGSWPAQHAATNGMLEQLVEWSETLRRTRQVVLLLIDGLDLFMSPDHPARESLLWLLKNGPEAHVWPVAAVNPARLSRLNNCLDLFHTRILGNVRNARNLRMLTDDPQVDLSGLEAGTQFGLSQPEGWLRFILPPLS